jgi:hypothetical protein
MYERKGPRHLSVLQRLQGNRLGKDRRVFRGSEPALAMTFYTISINDCNCLC